jgi:hypothetical protein
MAISIKDQPVENRYLAIVFHRKRKYMTYGMRNNSVRCRKSGRQDMRSCLILIRLDRHMLKDMTTARIVLVIPNDDLKCDKLYL